MYSGYGCCGCRRCRNFPFGACPCLGCYDVPGTVNVDYSIAFGSGTLGLVNYMKAGAYQGDGWCNDYCGPTNGQGCGHISYLGLDVASNMLASLSHSFSASFRVEDLGGGSYRCGVQTGWIELANRVQCDTRTTCDKCLSVDEYVRKWEGNVPQLVWRSFCIEDGQYGTDEEHGASLVFKYTWHYQYGAFLNANGTGPRAYVGMSYLQEAFEYIDGSLWGFAGGGDYYTCSITGTGDNCTNYETDPPTPKLECKCADNVITSITSPDVIFSGGSGGDINFGPNGAGTISMTYTPDDPS